MAISPFKLDSGALILFETPTSDDALPRQAARDQVEKLAANFGESLAPLTEAARLMLKAVKEANPKKVTLEFGVELGGKGGIPMITEGNAKANLKVILVWES